MDKFNDRFSANHYYFNHGKVKEITMNYTKSTIKKQIREMEIGVRMGADILETVKAFEHYAQVNKRFTDKLKELGYHAYIFKDNFSSTLSCNYQEWDENGRLYIKCEIRHYKSECFGKSPFTWDGIKNEVSRYNFANRLIEAQARLAAIDGEIPRLRELLAYLQNCKFTCFDLFKPISEVEDALRNAEKDEVLI